MLLRRESDPIIGNDSFESFEFILKTAREKNASVWKLIDGLG